MTDASALPYPGPIIYAKFHRDLTEGETFPGNVIQQPVIAFSPSGEALVFPAEVGRKMRLVSVAEYGLMIRDYLGEGHTFWELSRSPVY